MFDKGASATENSLLTAGRSLIVENNYGYQDPFGPNTGAVTEPGFARVDINKDGKGCTDSGPTATSAAPTVVPKLSTKTGLIYAYTRPPDPTAQGYFWTAIDFRTGKTAGASTPARAWLQQQLRGAGDRPDGHRVPGTYRSGSSPSVTHLAGTAAPEPPLAAGP